MIKVLAGLFGLLFAMVVGFTFMPTNINVDALVSEYNNTVVYSKSMRSSKDSITPTQGDAVQQHVQSVVTQQSPAGNPLMLYFPAQIGPNGKGIDFVSGYGMRKGVSQYPFHEGLDFSRTGVTGEGFTIHSATTGTVTFAGRATGGSATYGNLIKITDPRTGLEYRYAHLKSVSVKAGDSVSYGQQIGIMGGTGKKDNSYGVHLHFEIHHKNVKPGVLPDNINKYNRTVDPASDTFTYDETTKPNPFKIVQTKYKNPVFGPPSSGANDPPTAEESDKVLNSTEPDNSSTSQAGEPTN